MLTLVLLGLGLRLAELDASALFIDEAESALNALSILEHGYPADHYLGLPMFENTLTEPWPESEEYEFRDTSYANGKAVYHGWLPLYAMAASLALHGIGPDERVDPPRVLHGPEAVRTRIRAVRLPSVAFALLLMLAVFGLGRALHGTEAGLAALLAVALTPKFVWLAQQARYYSAALALATLMLWCALRVRSHGRWRDFLAAGLAGVALFHTHSVVLVILLGPCALLLPGALRHERGGAKLVAALAVGALGILPWMLWTGYLEHASGFPLARASLRPVDYLAYVRDREFEVAGFLTCVTSFALAWILRRRLPAPWAGALARSAFPLALLTTWVVAGYLGFLLLMPAASCTFARLTHVLLVGLVLLQGVVLAELVRVVGGRPRFGGAALVLLALLALRGDLFRRERGNPHETRAMLELVEHLRARELTPTTRLYALPFQHFCLTYLTGLPVQSIAPVRREFLERYPGEILLLETTRRLPHPRWERVLELAAARGIDLSGAREEEWVPRLDALVLRAELEPLVREVRPEPGPQPPWVPELVATLVREAAFLGPGYFDFAADNPAMFAGTPPMTLAEFWPRFFYRFVEPETRMGARLNYAGRMRAARAWILSSGWVVLDCPPLPSPGAGASG
ncbi:MAG TPA: glycosyltransferase family 39 protein [Planctomycetota bacterium]